jgi:hypothetical protein
LLRTPRLPLTNLFSINNNMEQQKRTPRKYPEIPTVQWSTRYSRAKAQALFRGEGWQLSPKEFWETWKASGLTPGPKSTDGCMIRLDKAVAWHVNNVVVVERRNYMRKNFYENCLKKEYVESIHGYVAP